ncbi:MAG: hypothetical protein KatS3mg050_0399 [Litorilinea sp.]|nr:MAG: hypothetical protein KatS3mg050_0399 [Litorilinea sp.]
MTKEPSSENWQLQESDDADDRWKLQESEQKALGQWELQQLEAPSRDWQPVEYAREPEPRRNWLLPAVVVVALLAVLAYGAFMLWPRLFPATPEQTPAALTPAPAQETAVQAETTPGGVTPEAVPTQAPAVTAPTAVPTQPPQPTPPPPTPATVEVEFATVISPVGVNARQAPDTNAEVLRILLEGERYLVLGTAGADNSWLELFLNETPLAEGQTISGTVAYAAADFLAREPDALPAPVYDAVLAYLGRTPTAEVPAEIAAPEATPETPLAETGAEPVGLTVTVSVTAGLNARSAPSTESEIIQLLENGTTLTPVARSADGQWIQVVLDGGREAWLFREFLTTNGDLDALPIAGAGAEVAPTPALTTTAPVASSQVITTGFVPPAPFTNTYSVDAPVVAVTSAGGVNARATPSTEASVITQIPQGAALTAVGRSADDAWIQIQLPGGATAWVARAVVLSTPAVNGLPVVEPSAAAPAVPAPTPTPAPSAGTPTATVRLGLLAIYDSPGAGQQVVEYVSIGAVLSALGRNEAGDWIQVQSSEGTPGWVPANAVELSVPVETLPVVQ